MGSAGTPRAPLAVAASCATLLAGCALTPRIGGQAESGARRLGKVVREEGCVERDGLPDRRCTPGAIRSGVSLARICRYGYSRSVRPPESYTEALKLSQMRAYGLSGSASAYEEDHIVPLALGGAPYDPANLWPQPRGGPDNAYDKDRLEAWAARMACAGRMPSSALQREMAADWTALYRHAFVDR